MYGQSSAVSSERYPQSPPPPYSALLPRPVPYYQQQYRSEQNLQLVQLDRVTTNQLRANSTTGVSAAGPLTIDPQMATRRNDSNPPYQDEAMNLMTGSMDPGVALCDQIASRLNEVLCELEGENAQPNDDAQELTRGLTGAKNDFEGTQRHPRVAASRAERGIDPSSGGIISFKKTWMYANSRLPPQMVPLKVYVPTWSIFCRAAAASMDVYSRSKGNGSQEYIEADWRHGTKAMAFKSACLDEKNLIVFAIRGSKWNLFDWAINFRPAPTEPTGFLDDNGNACHAGFLHVAKAMVRPVAARLRQLLEQDPGRAASSLVLTGHSAGGAVASLLYMHMMSTLVESELNVLTGCFKRVHCVTFGAPTVSLLPLQNPNTGRRKKNIFVAFANEGDPVVRVDKEYIASLCRLIATPAPIVSTPTSSFQGLRAKASRQKLKRSNDQIAPHSAQAPTWSVPSATLSNAGRLVLLRRSLAREQTTEAVCISDSELRNVIFGDPAMHDMALYKQRVDELAIAAVIGRDAA